MKKLLITFFFLVPALAVAQPAIRFKTVRHDFGAVAQGPQLEYRFEFSNAGTEELILQAVRTS